MEIDSWLSHPHEIAFNQFHSFDGPDAVALKSTQDPFSQFLIVARHNNPLIPAWLTGPQHGLEQSVTSMWDAQLLLIEQGGQVTTSTPGFAVKRGVVIGIA